MADMLIKEILINFSMPVKFKSVLFIQVVTVFNTVGCRFGQRTSDPIYLLAIYSFKKYCCIFLDVDKE
jgi:hypothetical protein